MKIAVYPGTFDPVTYGHLDVIKRGSSLFEHLIVAVGHNPLKKSLFSVQERMDMISGHIKELHNVEVDSFGGMLVDYLKKKDTNVILRGIRTVSDFENEFQRALTNRVLRKDVETVFVMTSQQYSFLNSSLIKEAVYLGGNVREFVPQDIEEQLKCKLKSGYNGC
ncbi:MAG: pantetheine-phosphate adenylyltransferase [Candidatus Anammoxibacter sp.]